MAIYHRDAFLNTLADKLGRTRRVTGVTRPIWDYSPQWDVLRECGMDDLVDVLKKQCDVIHTTVEQVPYADLSEALTRALSALECRSVVLPEDARFREYGLDSYFEQYEAAGGGVYRWDPSKGQANVTAAQGADVGITFSEVTLAESATVIVYSERGIGRSVSLLPKNYIAIIPRSTIVPRFTQAVEWLHRQTERGQRLPSCINFISGPSNSADIEMNLVVGVHGPVKATYILVDDK